MKVFRAPEIRSLFHGMAYTYVTSVDIQVDAEVLLGIDLEQVHLVEAVSRYSGLQGTAVAYRS
jgi:hypothetical protein